jgi:hypothetical protein
MEQDSFVVCVRELTEPTEDDNLCALEETSSTALSAETNSLVDA